MRGSRGEVAEQPERQPEGDRRADVDAHLRQHLHQRLHALADRCGARRRQRHACMSDRHEQQAEDRDAGQQERDVRAIARVLGERHRLPHRRAQELQIHGREAAPHGRRDAPRMPRALCTQIRAAGRAEVAAGGRAAIRTAPLPPTATAVAASFSYAESSSSPLPPIILAARARRRDRRAAQLLRRQISKLSAAAKVTHRKYGTNSSGRGAAHRPGERR